MKDIEAWDMLHGNNCEKKSLSAVLKEMGFDDRSYMVIRRNDPALKVGQSLGDDGNIKEDPELSFGGNTLKDKNFAVIGHGAHRDIKGQMTDFQAIDLQMQAFSDINNNGDCINGMTGSNNGIYAAMANEGDEFILTKDPEIAHQLESQLGFAKNQLGVPLSNGGEPQDLYKNLQWKNVEYHCQQAIVGRMRGTKELPKEVKSPFRDNRGVINKDYAAFRATKLQGR